MPFLFSGAALLIADINDTRSALAAMNPPANLPVGNSEAGAYYNTLVMEAMDFGVRVSFLPLFDQFHDIVVDGKCPSVVWKRFHR